MRVILWIFVCVVLLDVGMVALSRAAAQVDADEWIPVYDGQWLVHAPANERSTYRALGRRLAIGWNASGVASMHAFGGGADETIEGVAAREASVRCDAPAMIERLPMSYGTEVVTLECLERPAGFVDDDHAARRFLLFRHPDGSYLVLRSEGAGQATESFVRRIRPGQRALQFGNRGFELHVCGGRFAFDLPPGSFATGSHDGTSWSVRIPVRSGAWVEGTVEADPIDAAEWRRLRSFHGGGDPPTDSASLGSADVVIALPERGIDAFVDGLDAPIVLDCDASAPGDQLAVLDISFHDRWGASKADLVRATRTLLASARWSGSPRGPRVHSVLDLRTEPAGSAPAYVAAIALVVMLALIAAYADERDAL